MQEITRYEANIVTIQQQMERMQPILEAALEFAPPTEQHTEYRQFLIDQLKKTIDFDCDPTWHKKRLEDTKLKLSSIDPALLRQAKLTEAEEKIRYHIEKQKEDDERAASANEWVKAVFDALSQKEVSHG